MTRPRGEKWCWQIYNVYDNHNNDKLVFTGNRIQIEEKFGTPLKHTIAAGRARYQRRYYVFPVIMEYVVHDTILDVTDYVGSLEGAADCLKVTTQRVREAAARGNRIFWRYAISKRIAKNNYKR